MKKISIIIACFNAAQWLWDAFNSLKNQTMDLDDLELIFVDDASTDSGKTWDTLQAIEKEAPESVVLIHLDENMRQGGARNVGMQYMTGKYMLFLDADDMYRPETCQELYDLAESYDADMIQFDHDIVWRDMGDNSMPPRKEDDDKVFVVFDVDDKRRIMLTGEAGDFGCTNKIYRTDLIRKSGATFAEHKVYEEPKFVYPQFVYARNILYITAKYYIYRKHEGSTMTSLLGDRLLEHPTVQLELQEYLMGKADIYEKYKPEIEYHFLRSFFQETLVFSVFNQGILPLGFFEEMQGICKSLFPDYVNNRYVKEDPILIEALEALSVRFDSQKELNDHIFKFVKKHLRSFTQGIRVQEETEISEKPLVSVVMPVYNAEKYLDESISSIVDQSYDNFELIIVLRESEDRSVEICNSWVQKDQRIRIIDQDKPNLWYARNKGIRDSKGKYFCACDADDKYCPEYLEKMVGVAERDGADIVECMFYMANEDLSEVNGYYALSRAEEWGHDYIERHCAPAVWKYMVRKEFWTDKGLEYPESRTMADLAMYSLVFTLAGKIGYVYEPLYIYRQFDDSISHKRTTADVKLDAFEKVCAFITGQFKERNLFEKKRLVLLSQIETHAGDLFDAINEDADVKEVADRISGTIKKYYSVEKTLFDYGIFGWGRHDLDQMMMILRKNPVKDFSFTGDVELHNLTKPDVQYQLTDLFKQADFDIAVVDFMNEALSLLKGLDNVSTYVKHWALGAQVLVSTLKANGTPRVFLLERYLAEKYYGRNKVATYDNVETIRSVNSILKELYDFFKDMYPNTELVRAVPSDLNIAGDNLTPVAEHLALTYYYEELMDCIHLMKQ